MKSAASAMAMATALSLAMAAPAKAGLYSDDLARCLVGATSTDDKLSLIRWVVVQITRHPNVSDLSRLTPEKEKTANMDIARMFERLITDSCRTESKAAFRYEGQDAFKASFEVLGTVAMQELVSHKDVDAGFSGFTQYLNEEAFKGIFPEKKK